MIVELVSCQGSKLTIVRPNLTPVGNTFKICSVYMNALKPTLISPLSHKELLDL